MNETRTLKIITTSLVALLVIGILALAAAGFIKQGAPIKTAGATQISAAAATATIPVIAQATIAPQPTSQPPQATPTIQAVATQAVQDSTSTPQPQPTMVATAATVATTVATPIVRVTAIAEASAITGGPEPTAVQQRVTPTAVAGGGGGPKDRPVVPGTGNDDPDPVTGLTPPPLLPGVPTAVAGSRPSSGSSSGVPNIKPTPVVPQATPTVPKPTVVSVKATPKPKPGQIVLPNGVIYGERKPNLPNRIVRIASSSIRLDTSVYEVYAPKGAWEVADYAAGHHYNSKNPGEGGNIVMAGHNNWRGEVFRYLVDLKPGNVIKVWTLDGKEHRYTVESVKKLLETGASKAQRLENAKVMDPTPGEQLTLITCWPYTTYTHRVIIVAKPSP